MPKVSYCRPICLRVFFPSWERVKRERKKFPVIPRIPVHVFLRKTPKLIANPCNLETLIDQFTSIRRKPATNFSVATKTEPPRREDRTMLHLYKTMGLRILSNTLHIFASSGHTSLCQFPKKARMEISYTSKCSEKQIITNGKSTFPRFLNVIGLKSFHSRKIAPSYRCLCPLLGKTLQGPD